MYLSASVVVVSTWGAITSARPLIVILNPKTVIENYCKLLGSFQQLSLPQIDTGLNYTQDIQERLCSNQLTDLRYGSGKLLGLVQVELEDDVTVMSHLSARCVVQPTVVTYQHHVIVELRPAAVLPHLSHTNHDTTAFNIFFWMANS